MEPRLRFNLDELLKQNKLKASDLSKLTGIPKQTLSEWRSGLVPKSILSLKKVASTLGVSLDELVFRAASDSDPASLASGESVRSSLPESLRTCSATRHEAVVGLSKRGYPLFISAAFQERIGWSEALLQRRSLYEFLLLEDAGPVCLAMNEALTSGQPCWVHTRIFCHDLRILPQRCLFIPLSSGEDVLAIFYQVGDAGRPGEGFDQLTPVELPPLLTRVQENFERLRPTSRLQISDLLPGRTYTTRPKSLTQLLFSALQDLSALVPSLESPAGQVFEIVAYEGEQVLELQLNSPSFSSDERSSAGLEVQGPFSLVPYLAPALGARIEWKNWGTFWRAQIALPKVLLSL